MEKMTHRERVLAALSHRQPDRVPIDLGSTRDSSIVVEGYERLKQHFAVRQENILLSRMMQVVDVDEQILQALEIDVRGVFPGGQPDELIGTDRYSDEWGVERVSPPGSHYYDQVSFPLAGEITLQDITSHRWPDPHHPARTQGLRERAREVRETMGCATVLNLPSAFVHTSQYLRGFSDWYTDIAADKKLIGALFDATLDIGLAMCQVILEEVGDEVDVLLASDDLGLQGGLMMSPDAYRELIKPRHRRYLQLMHELSPAKVLFHTCGSVVDIVDDLIETGVDILNPIQVTAGGMEPAKLKQKYGDELAFWGAIDTQYVLPHGSVEDVQAEVERRIEELGADGGYVLGAVHNIQPDVPLENILTMYRRAAAYVPSYAR